MRVAVFVDGAFWHGHPSRHRPGRSGVYWDSKIAGNVERDRRVDRELREEGWLVLRVWDFEVRADVDQAVARVIAALDERIDAADETPNWWSASRAVAR
jgi:DNA mismatch endonuclease (patch repair protein)